MVLERDPEGWVKRKDTESLRVGQKEGGALSWEVMTRGHPQAQAQQGAKGVQGTPGCHVSLEDTGQWKWESEAEVSRCVFATVAQMERQDWATGRISGE